MRKLIFLGCAAAAVLASCSNEEPVAMPKSSAVSFDNAFVNNSTRATDITAANIEDFNVYAFMGNPAGVVFAGETVTKNETTGEWEYENLQYWTPVNTYWFSAVAPVTGAHWTYAPITETADSYLGGGTLSFNNEAANGEQDLLYAWKPSILCESTTMSKVGFTFDHQLSRVKFTFQNDFNNSLATIVVKDVKITDAVADGTLDLNVAAPAWVCGNGTFTLAFDNYAVVDGEGNTNSHIAAKGGQGATGTKYMISANRAYNLTFTVELYQGGHLAGTYNHTVTVPAVNMLRGYSYNFTAKIDASNVDPVTELRPIEFEVTGVNGFVDGGNTDVPVTAPTE